MCNLLENLTKINFLLWFMFSVVINLVQKPVAQYKVVNTQSGPIRGELLKTFLENKPYYSFKGIPYATPPTRERRFLPPLPAEPWTTVRDCFTFGNICLQQSVSNISEIVGNEDCLYLNIYTPLQQQPAAEALRAVMFYIHGGAWYMGFSDEIGPDFLINEDIVFVTINYRLGVMGFMSLGTPEYSGNQGLKDQQLALQWIHANIQHFGGDRSRITILGDSAGSISSQFHMFAPASQGLFRRTIEISFTFDIWGILAKSNHLSDMYMLAEKLNNSIRTFDDLVDFLKFSADPYVIAANFPFEMLNNAILPIIENQNALQPFLRASPKEFMLEMDNFTTNIDVMAGYTTGETLFLDRSPKEIRAFLEKFEIKLPSIHFNRQYNSSDYGIAAQKIYDFYFQNRSVNVYNAFDKLESDVYQRYFIDKRIKTLAARSTGKTYYYRFGLETSLNFFKYAVEAQHRPGAAHGDDLCYVYKCNFNEFTGRMYENLTLHSIEYGWIKTMSDLYANFAKYGDPLPKGVSNFVPVRPGRYAFLDISNDGLRVGEDPFKVESTFWSNLMNQHPRLLTLWH